MKQLTLIRHAKSSWKFPELSDFERPLNKRGKRDLPLMAERLAQRNLSPDLLLSSSAKRTTLTAQAIKTRLRLSGEQCQFSELIYEASHTTLLQILRQPPNHHQHIMLVGHNPGLEMLGYYLGQESFTRENLDKFPTAAVMQLQLAIDSWHKLGENCAKLLWFDYPKKHSSTST